MAYPFVVGPVVGDEAELPAMFAVRQHFDVLPAVDALAALREEWPRAKAALSALAPGASIAVAVGSRGIADIAVLVRGIVERLREAGCKPFVVPAMGSHGGATAAGQTEVLAHLGVTEAAVGAPVRTTLDVERLWVSAGCLDYLAPPPAVVVDPALRRLPFDAAGNLVSPFTGA